MAEDQPAVVQSDEQSQQAGEDIVTTVPSGVTIGAHQVMLKEIRSWAVWSLGFGVVNLLIGGLSASWGVVLLIVGLASFLFREASMFVIYGVTMAWVAVTNILSGEASWIVFALFQLYLAFRVFRQFFQFRQVQRSYESWLAEESPEEVPTFQRAARFFPWITGLLGGLSLGGLIVILVSIFFAAVISGSANFPGFVDFLAGLVINLGVLGFATGLSALLSGYRYKAVSILGMIASILTLVIRFVLILL